MKKPKKNRVYETITEYQTTLNQIKIRIWNETQRPTMQTLALIEARIKPIVEFSTIHPSRQYKYSKSEIAKFGRLFKDVDKLADYIFKLLSDIDSISAVQVSDSWGRGCILYPDWK